MCFPGWLVGDELPSTQTWKTDALDRALPPKCPSNAPRCGAPSSGNGRRLAAVDAPNPDILSELSLVLPFAHLHTDNVKPQAARRALTQGPSETAFERLTAGIEARPSPLPAEAAEPSPSPEPMGCANGAGPLYAPFKSPFTSNLVFGLVTAGACPMWAPDVRSVPCDKVADSNNIVLGCTDPLANNYNSDANCNLPYNDPKACRYTRANGKNAMFMSPTPGCWDSRASNYDPFSTRNGGSEACAPIAGCMNPDSIHYDPAAQISDRSCKVLKVCNDSQAVNFVDTSKQQRAHPPPVANVAIGWSVSPQNERNCSASAPASCTQGPKETSIPPR